MFRAVSTSPVLDEGLSQTSFSSSPPRPKKEYKSVLPLWRGSAKAATRSLLIWGGGLVANLRSPVYVVLESGLTSPCVIVLVVNYIKIQDSIKASSHLI